MSLILKKRRREEITPPQSTVINVMTAATGIPPPTEIIKDLNEFATKLHDLSSKVDNIYVCLNEVVSDEIEKKMA